MSKRAVLAAIILVAVVTAGFALRYRTGEGRETLVLTTFPGVDGDLRMLLQGCPGIDVEPIAPPGSDPHTYSLKPSDVQRIKRALLIVSTGHAPFEESVKRYAPEKTVEIPEIPGIRLASLPSGAANLHMPIYDPENYKVFINYMAARLSSLLPRCAQIIEENRRTMISIIASIETRYRDSLQGARAVASSPIAQYAVSWLGLNVSVYLVSEHEAQATPEQVSQARTVLESGGIAIVVVDHTGAPIGPADRFLLDEASKTGAPVIHVEAPYEPGPVLDKIKQVAFEAAQLGAG